MNPILLYDIPEEDKEINLIIQKDNFEELKAKLVYHIFDQNYKDKKGICLIEKSVFFQSKNA